MHENKKKLKIKKNTSTLKSDIESEKYSMGDYSTHIHTLPMKGMDQ